LPRSPSQVASAAKSFDQIIATARTSMLAEQTRSK
jgi:hypothetical protein